MRPCRLGEVFHLLDIEIERIAVERTHRKIWAGVVWLAVRNGMQGIQANEACAEIYRGPVDKLVKIRDISASPVPLRTKRVETYRDTSGFPLMGISSPRAGDDSGGTRDGGFSIGEYLDLDAVIAERHIRGQRHHFTGKTLPAQLSRT